MNIIGTPSFFSDPSQLLDSAVSYFLPTPEKVLQHDLEVVQNRIPYLLNEVAQIEARLKFVKGMTLRTKKTLSDYQEALSLAITKILKATFSYELFEQNLQDLCAHDRQEDVLDKEITIFTDELEKLTTEFHLYVKCAHLIKQKHVQNLIWKKNLIRLREELLTEIDLNRLKATEIQNSLFKYS